MDELLDLAFAILRGDGVPEPPGGYDSGHLKNYLKKNKLHLPELCKTKLSLLPPDVAVTYMWNATTLRNVLAALRRKLDGRFPAGKARVWIDAFFNDPRSDQVRPPLCGAAAVGAPPAAESCETRGPRPCPSPCALTL